MRYIIFINRTDTDPYVPLFEVVYVCEVLVVIELG